MSTPATIPISTALAIQAGQVSFTETQVAALQQLGLDKALEADLAVFFHTCVRTGLDPFRKQIYMIGRWDSRANRNKYTIQTGIDGYRVIANRTGSYVGSFESWVANNDGHPISATVTVRKLVGSSAYDFEATAHWSEYSQTGKDGRPIGLWAKMPHRMLAKCAEALALRKAFPEDLAGIYTDEEMSQAEQQPANLINVTSTQATPVAKLPETLHEDPYGWTYSEIEKATSVDALNTIVNLAKHKLTEEERAALRPIYLGRKAQLETGQL